MSRSGTENATFSPPRLPVPLLDFLVRSTDSPMPRKRSLIPDWALRDWMVFHLLQPTAGDQRSVEREAGREA